MSTENALPPTDSFPLDGGGSVGDVGEGAVMENESQQVVMCDCMSYDIKSMSQNEGRSREKTNGC